MWRGSLFKSESSRKMNILRWADDRVSWGGAADLGGGDGLECDSAASVAGV